MKFKEGDRVKLKVGGGYDHQRIHYAKDGVGTITRVHTSQYTVVFDNGYENSYTDRNLIPATIPWRLRLK